ncbi:MAG: hypothetical protein WAN33_08900 [Candidatus Acidiferrales bacterium]|jgi:hypothetical protein
MVGNEMRPSIRYLVFGPITKSAAFWAEIGLLIIGASNLGIIWFRFIRSEDRTPTITGFLVLLLFAFVLGSCVYFADLAKLKVQAQQETDLAKCATLCQRADFRFKVFCGAMGIFVIGLTVIS